MAKINPDISVEDVLAETEVTKEDKDNYELAFLLLSVDEQERITIWEGETPDINLAK